MVSSSEVCVRVHVAVAPGTWVAQSECCWNYLVPARMSQAVIMEDKQNFFGLLCVNTYFELHTRGRLLESWGLPQLRWDPSVPA